tara:strand:+ start:715 stop:2226 length:1512 start_codon:yes stop_codon:yes gene_type:complete
MLNTHQKLEMLNITKSFPGVEALKDVSITASSGQIMGLVGVNGAGKSTLMNILGGIYSNDSGKIILNDNQIQLKSPNDAAKIGISFIHQDLLYFASQTVAENIYMTDLPQNNYIPFFISKIEMISSTKQVLNMLGSDINPNSLMEELSTGEKQIVEIARALAAGSDIVIFDEPTSSLSIKEKERLFQVIRKLKSENKIIIYISHFLNEIQELCDTYVVLRNGSLVGKGNVADESKNNIIRMIIGRDLVSSKNQSKKTSIETILEIKNLIQGDLLQGINLTLNKGEVLGLWGLMGSGRTELIRSALGLDPIDSGKIYLFQNGKANQISPKQLLKNCGYVTESRRIDGLFISEPVWKNITSGNLNYYSKGRLNLIDSNAEMQSAKDHIEKLNIKTPSHSTSIENLSGGNQQKTIFSRWLDKRPKILILDEPTRGVDVGAKQEIGTLITELARDGAAILLISSEIEEIVSLSNRVLVLREGVIAYEALGEDINEVNLMSIALGKEQ